MKQILRYKLLGEIAVPIVVLLPIDAQIIHFDYQNVRGHFSLWAEATRDHLPTQRTFIILPTGAEVPADGAHVGSCLADGGLYVWHLYDVSPTDYAQRSQT